jgi:hypothetical protein
MRYKFYYASLDLQSDIPCIELENQEELIYQLMGHHHDAMPNKRLIPLNESPFFDRLDKAKDSIVYLCAIQTPPNEDGVILIDSNPENILSFVLDHTKTPTMKDVFLQEYESYETAYFAALSMKEISHLCYN